MVFLAKRGWEKDGGGGGLLQRAICSSTEEMLQPYDKAFM